MIKIVADDGYGIRDDKDGTDGTDGTDGSGTDISVTDLKIPEN